MKRPVVVQIESLEDQYEYERKALIREGKQPVHFKEPNKCHDSMQVLERAFKKHNNLDLSEYRKHLPDFVRFSE